MMKIKNIFNNYGFSLPMALVSLAIISSATIYIMNLKKVAKTQSSAARTINVIELEKRRISSALANHTTCYSNFGTFNAIRPSIAFLKGATVGSELVRQGSSYFNKMLTVTSISTRAIRSSDPNFTTFSGTDNGFMLVISYSAPMNIAYTGVKNTIIEIPMYMKNAAAVTQCYSLAQNDQVNTAINHSCSPETILANSGAASTLNHGVVTESDCTHTVSFGGLPERACPYVTTAGSSQVELISGFDLLTGPPAGVQDFPASKCTGVPTSCTVNALPLQSQFSFGITNSSSTCGYPGGNPRDTTCAAGDILYRTAGGAVTCVTPNCALAPFGANYFINSVSPTLSCYKAQPTSCPANYYVTSIKAGAVSCLPLPTWNNVDCWATLNSFGKSTTRNNSTWNGVLNCGSAYSKRKECFGTPATSVKHRTTFAQSFTAAGVNCNDTAIPVYPGAGTAPTVAAPPQTGNCGTADIYAPASRSAPVGSLCSIGTAGAISQPWPYFTWICYGNGGGGNSATCITKRIVDGGWCAPTGTCTGVPNKWGACSGSKTRACACPSPANYGNGCSGAATVACAAVYGPCPATYKTKWVTYTTPTTLPTQCKYTKPSAYTIARPKICQ